MDNFESLIEALQSAGYFHAFQPLSETRERLVCASNRRPDGALCGNSFWLTRHNNKLYLVTWTPRIYEVTRKAELTDLCLALLPISRVPIYLVPADIVEKYGLEEVSNETLDYFDA